MANWEYPYEFIQENLGIELNVIHEAYRSGVRRLVFLGRRPLRSGVSPPGRAGHALGKDAKSGNSSAIGATEDDALGRPARLGGRDSVCRRPAGSCIYPRLAPQPLKEEYLLTGPLEETNRPYAIAKIAGIELCRSLNREYGTSSLSGDRAPQPGCNGYVSPDGEAREKDAGSVNSSAICATEDALSRRPVRPGGRGLISRQARSYLCLLPSLN